MKDQEEIYEFENQKIKYKFQPSKQDRKHLLIIFSGFGSGSSVSYDFTGAPSGHCRSNILWIKDEIDSECTYYLSTSKDFNIEKAIISLVNNKIKLLGLGKAECTLMGFSKGGSAALYYGLKYDFINIISSCPQTAIGSYVAKYWPHTAENMMGNTPSAEKIDYLDNLIPGLLSADRLTDRNIYLITSPNDEQYSTQIEPYLAYFSRYKNFSFIFTKSSMVWQHNKVTRYNLPIILSIIYAHGEGIYPILGQNINGVDLNQDLSRHNIISNQKSEKKAISTVSNIYFLDGKLYINGVAFIRGYECPNYENIKHTLILNGKNNKYRFVLGKLLNKDINYNYFYQTYCDYSAAAFTTVGQKGIDITHLEKDAYVLSVEVESAGTVVSAPLKSNNNINYNALIGSDELYIGSTDFGLIIHRKSILTKRSQSHFEITSTWYKDNLLHLEGIFAVQGVNVSSWGDASYYIVLQSESDSHPFKIGMLDLVTTEPLFDDTHDIYSKSYFSTVGRKGVDIGSIPRGEYDVFVVMSHHGKIFTQNTSKSIIWDGVSISSFNDVTHVGIIGSCVTRDNFNSRFNCNYKDKFICSALQNQSSLVSVVSPAINISDDSFSDLDPWSAKDTLRDFQKTIWNDLQEKQPDVLIFDLFTDARFTCISVDNSFVTLNEWKLAKSNYFNTIVNNEKIGMDINENQFLEIFKRGLLTLKDRLQSCCQNTIIVLHAARGVQYYCDNGEEKNFNLNFVNTLNDRWEKLDNIFIDVFNPLVIDVFEGEVFKGDGAHPWGCSTVHYENKYYSRFLSKLEYVLLEKRTC
ncbi:DUF6270 domain-containing protein [Aeromonas cavernicola]|uniref:Uncharacterized protein n=1 Tax=Aeromonas cavernicola TaxID=1006623 RepID=A0A2H9U307_9GAMM|nr:DUF6270 domain-containing protein [Aeromonas cavernicola]PJG58404.1 hypothetical protein CUC53_12790 [Aeromonas cavernicola]